jgi:hypothetical protein
LLFAVLAGQFGVFAVEDEIDAAVPMLDDLPAFMDLAADRLIGEVVAEGKIVRAARLSSEPR